MKIFILSLVSLLLFVGCGEKKEESSTPGMKCGAGKCGANMFDGNSALAKKKKNILTQMREDDSRKDCIIKAKTTKEAYECVRDPKTKKMTIKCGSAGVQESPTPAMKCGAGKCGSSME